MAVKNWRTSTQGLGNENPGAVVLVPSSHRFEGALLPAMGNGSRGYGFEPVIKGKGAFYTSRDRGDSWQPVMNDTP